MKIRKIIFAISKKNSDGRNRLQKNLARTIIIFLKKLWSLSWRPCITVAPVGIGKTRNQCLHWQNIPVVAKNDTITIGVIGLNLILQKKRCQIVSMRLS